jgi:putative ABC transport system permease protein
MLETLSQDIRYAVRGLRANPGFTIGVVLTIALGIGANAAMFGIVDRMLFRPPPFLIDPSSTHRLYQTSIDRGKEYTSNFANQYARYRDVVQWTTSFSRTAGMTNRQISVGVGDAAREMWVASVSASFFGFFDAPPVLGRYFTPAEDSIPNGSPVAVLSYATWQLQYGGRRDALGARVQIGPAVYTIIGVAPRGFVGTWPNDPPTYFTPITKYGSTQAASFGWLGTKNWWSTYQWGWMQAMVRRKPGVTIERANADLTSAYIRSYEAQLVENKGGTPTRIMRPRAFVGSILPERGPNESSVAKVATWVGGVALIVLLIAMANVANLLLARALRRRREIALRLALGISRARLLSQLLTESVVLAVLGGAAGVLVAQWGGAALRAGLLPSTAPIPALSDPRTLLFTGIAALAVGILTGVAPLLQAGRASLTNDLRSGSREGTYHRSRARIVLLVFQGALSVVLLVGAGLFVRSLRNVEGVRLGFDVDPILSVNLNMRGAKLDSLERIALRQRVIAAAKSVPGVEHVTLTNSLPFWSHWSTNLFVTGLDTVSKLGQFELNAVSPDYFATMGTRVLRGRGFTDEDGGAAQRVMVVSEGMAKRIWPEKDALGQCIRVSADTMPCTYVVGVAENIKNQNLSDEDGYYYYMPASQYAPAQGDLLVRTRGLATRYSEAVRRALQREMPGAAYVSITPFSEVVGQQVQSWKLGATMFTAFGILALVLAAIGLYSVIAYNVAQRTHEMGVRVALGAQSADVIRMVVREGATLGGTGVVMGTAAALLAGRWVKPLLFDVSPTDPAVFVAVVALLLAVAVAASWVPARRAARVDPQEALRSD